MPNVSVKLNTGLIPFTFRNEEDEVFVSFKINPSDINLAKRCDDFKERFEKKMEKFKEPETFEEMAELNSFYEEQLNYLLGAQEGPIIKKPYTATTQFPDGTVLANVILETVFEAVNEEAGKRAEAQKQHLEKYTSKYKK